jgi:hypothetical protein
MIYRPPQISKRNRSCRLLLQPHGPKRRPLFAADHDPIRGRVQYGRGFHFIPQHHFWGGVFFIGGDAGRPQSRPFLIRHGRFRQNVLRRSSEQGAKPMRRHRTRRLGRIALRRQDPNCERQRQGCNHTAHLSRSHAQTCLSVICHKAPPPKASGAPLIVEPLPANFVPTGRRFDPSLPRYRNCEVAA